MFLVLFAAASYVAGTATGASSDSVVVTATIAGATSLQNDCSAASATQLGSLLPGARATTATDSGSCQVSFWSTNTMTELRIGTADGQGATMGSTSAAWRVGRDRGQGLLALDRFSPSIAFATGHDGMITRTIDSGATWDDQWGLLSNHWVMDVDHVPGDSEKWVIVGGGGHIASTTNGVSSAPGMPTWTNHDAALASAGWPAYVNVEGVATPSASTWFIVGEDGYFGRTDDTGATWDVYTVGGATRWLDVTALSTTHVVASGSNSSIAITTNGGAASTDWTVDTHGWCSCWFTSVDASDATHIYAVTDAGFLVRHDGTTFVTTTAAPDRLFEPMSVSSPASDPTTVFVSSTRGRILRSTDSGATLFGTGTPAAGSLDVIEALSNTDVWAAGASRNMVATSNGTTWTSLATDVTKRPLRGVAASPVDGRKAIAVGGTGTILRTTDSGDTWTARASGTTQHLIDVTWSSATRVIAVGAAGVVVTSEDAGLTWTVRTSGTAQELQGVAAGAEYAIWAVGLGGTMLHSTNGGVTWTTVATGTTDAFESVAAIGTQRAWAVGDEGTIRRTIDGGATWSGGTGPPAWDHMAGVAAADASTVYIATRYSGIWKSTDGGANYTSLAGFWLVDWNSERIAVVGDVVMAQDKWGKVLTSIDAGATWSADDVFLDTVQTGFPTDLALIDAHTAFSVGDEGSIVDVDEASAVAASIADYTGGSNFASSSTTGAFGVCLQSLTNAAPSVGWTVDGGTCIADDADPWRAVPTAPTPVATAALGITGEAEFVWGIAARSDQPPGRYSAGIVFEAISPT
ncbi:MAG: hypothetical protein JWM90_973 [Thermoleophilia bacterium]|nr:hypothetical protein [Thermoleophilia bacterium]